MKSPGGDRDGLVQDKIEAIRDAIEQAKARAVTLQDMGKTPEPGDLGHAAIDLAGLERVLLGTTASAKYFEPYQPVAGAYMLKLPEAQRPVTFRRAILEGQTPMIRLMTYGTAEMTALLRILRPQWETGGTRATVRSDINTLEELERSIAQG